MDLKGSDNATGAVNQQERLDAYISGFVDGEGCFHVAIQRNSSTRCGWQIVPEFRVSQDVLRRVVLDLIKERIECGSIRENHRNSNDNTLVLVVRNRCDLLSKVIPFFERNPMLSCKQDEFVTFARIVREMDRGAHLNDEGFERLAAQARGMNGGGRYRRIYLNSDSRILRDHMPSTSLTLR
jgi:LAGLIDADG endonuclease